MILFCFNLFVFLKKLGILTADQKTEADDDIVDPWNVTSSAATGIDYDKLIGECFGLRERVFWLRFGFSYKEFLDSMGI